MSRIVSFTCNPFYENTYVLYDDTGECVIIDPGCYTKEEKEDVSDFITRNNLKPVLLINTHCHIDHVLGNRFIAEKYGLKLLMHRGELPVLHAVDDYAESLGIFYDKSPEPEIFVDEGNDVTFGSTKLHVLFTPGHSPASICFYDKESKFIVSGDVLFYDSIGRYDLPGGNLNTLMTSIRTKLLTLPDDITVYPGHGPHTTIGREKQHNPFLNEAGFFV